jgi:hypothetical protein
MFCRLLFALLYFFFWPLYCLSFLDLRLLITTLVSCGHCIVYILPRLTTSDYHFGILWPLYCLSFLNLRLLITTLVSFGHCIVYPSSTYGFWFGSKLLKENEKNIWNYAKILVLLIQIQCINLKITINKK